MIQAVAHKQLSIIDLTDVIDRSIVREETLEAQLWFDNHFRIGQYHHFQELVQGMGHTICTSGKGLNGSYKLLEQMNEQQCQCMLEISKVFKKIDIINDEGSESIEILKIRDLWQLHITILVSNTLINHYNETTKGNTEVINAKIEKLLLMVLSTTWEILKIYDDEINTGDKKLEPQKVSHLMHTSNWLINYLPTLLPKNDESAGLHGSYCSHN